MQLFVWDCFLKCLVGSTILFAKNFFQDILVTISSLACFKDISFGWGLHYLQLWCATHYWVSVFIPKMRRAIKKFLIFFSLFCRHASQSFYYLLNNFSFLHVSSKSQCTLCKQFFTDIADITIKSIQSLEALQDGEHEQQRRHFIYFLLHQVNVSRNFSSLMRKKACQVLNSSSILLKE